MMKTFSFQEHIMGRPRRNQDHNLTRHIYSRFINGEKLMEDNEYKKLMQQVIDETQEKYKFELISFEILDNHVHFMIKTLEGCEIISKIMQRIKSVFARRLNKSLKRMGPVWNERYKDVIAEFTNEPVKYILNLLWYLAYNSFRKGFCLDPRDYSYGAINHYLHENYQGKLKVSLAKEFLALGRTFAERVKVFLTYEQDYITRLSFC